MKQRHGGDHHSANRGFRWLTILHAFTPLDESAVAAAHQRACDDFEAMMRKFPRLWCQGAFELELVSIELLLSRYAKNQTKRETVMDMLGSCAGTMEYRVLVHSHMVIDVRDHDEDDVRAWMSKRWSKHHQVHMGLLHSDKSLRENIERLSEYPFKVQTMFNVDFISEYYGIAFREDKFLNNGQLAFMVDAYSRLGGNGLRGLLVGRGCVGSNTTSCRSSATACG